jgi:hypothetical protein
MFDKFSIHIFGWLLYCFGYAHWNVVMINNIIHSVLDTGINIEYVEYLNLQRIFWCPRTTTIYFCCG